MRSCFLATAAHRTSFTRNLATVHVCFVCTGNICRSPTAALVFVDYLRRAGLANTVQVTSAGISSWHVGDSIDKRAGEALTRNGYPVEDTAAHTAAQIGPEHLAADLLLAMDSEHEQALRRLVDDPSRVRMFRSFDTAAIGNLDVPDPYYGGRDGFDHVLAMIEAAMPGLLIWVRDQVEDE